jgi:hypothetical protein
VMRVVPGAGGSGDRRAGERAAQQAEPKSGAPVAATPSTIPMTTMVGTGPMMATAPVAGPMMAAAMPMAPPLTVAAMPMAPGPLTVAAATASVDAVAVAPTGMNAALTPLGIRRIRNRHKRERGDDGSRHHQSRPVSFGDFPNSHFSPPIALLRRYHMADRCFPR